MYQVSFEIFDHMKAEIILVSRRERNREKGLGVSGYPVSSRTDYNVISQTGTIM